jgi:26S proteasome regulatory subunit N1
MFTETTTANVDSARANLAGTFVNAFVNAGFGNDKLMAEAEEGQSWIYKNKDHGKWSIKLLAVQPFTLCCQA